ncbi:UNVERIFIED_CONTAM: hypothetical protein ABID98_005558 [Brevibacillus sp. OAP136]
MISFPINSFGKIGVQILILDDEPSINCSNSHLENLHFSVPCLKKIKNNKLTDKKGLLLERKLPII